MDCMQALEDLYTDFLLVTPGQATATGLSGMLKGEISHDRITRMLHDGKYGDRELWRNVKSVVRQREQEEGVLIIDDTVEEKPWMEENEIICWHHDHTINRTVKGVNQLTLLYHTTKEDSNGVSIPVGYQTIRKTEIVKDKKSGKEKRKSKKTKNDIAIQLLKGVVRKGLKYKYIVADKWFASVKLMNVIAHDLQKYFVFPLKDNRKIALTLEDQKNSRFVSVSELSSRHGTSMKVYLEHIDGPLTLYIKRIVLDSNKEVFMYLVTNDMQLEGEGLYQIYQRRWKVEEFYKSVKSLAAYAKSPAHSVDSQEKHLFLSLLAFTKLELLRTRTRNNHFALKGRLWLTAASAALNQWLDWKRAFKPDFELLMAAA